MGNLEQKRDIMLNEFYKDKKVFITGHTGFKGSWLALWLKKLGAKVCGYSLKPNTNPSMFDELKIEKRISKSIYGDILDYNNLYSVVKEFQPDIVFHLAAQPLVRLSYTEPLNTYMTNVIGSLNVLEACRQAGMVKAFVNITTDKCYENKEVEYGYKEDDPMGGYDMYSSSKGCVEIMSSSFRRSFLQDENSMLLATARAGNVIGGGDWAQDRLVPDCIRAITSKQKIEIRNPIAIRPWQHVLEPLCGYILLGKKLLENGYEFAQAYNFGPEESSTLKVSEIASKIVNYWGDGEIVIHKKDNLHEAGLLMLNIDKAKSQLGWQPIYNADKAVERTVAWYKAFYNNEGMLQFTLKQIAEYEDKLYGKIS